VTGAVGREEVRLYMNEALVGASCRGVRVTLSVLIMSSNDIAVICAADWPLIVVISSPLRKPAAAADEPPTGGADTTIALLGSL